MKRLTIFLLSLLIILNSTVTIFSDDNSEENYNLTEIEQNVEDKNQDDGIIDDNNVDIEEITLIDDGDATSQDDIQQSIENEQVDTNGASYLSVPEDLDVYQSYDGDLYIETRDYDYLNKLRNGNVKFYFYTSASGDAVVNRNISLSGNYDYSCVATFYSSSMNFYGYYDDTYCIEIDADDVYSNYLYSNIVYVETTASGYTPCVTKVYIDTDSYYKYAVPNDLQIVQNEYGLCFYTSNTDYVQRITNFEIGNNNRWYNFYNNDFSYNSRYNYYYISNEKLDSKNLLSGTYGIGIYADEYEDYYNELANIEIVTNVMTSPEDVTIYFDNSVGIVIECENSDYLQKINYVSLYCYDPYCYGSFYSDNLTYDIQINKLYIDKKYVIEKNLLTNDRYELHITANKYTDYYVYDIPLNFDEIYYEQSEAPDDITVLYNENGIVIDSKDKDYLNSISTITLFKDSGSDNFGSYYFNYDKYDECVYITNEKLSSRGLSGEHVYELLIASTGYKSTSITNLDITINKSPKLKEAPKSVSTYSSKYYGIDLYFNMSEYIENINEICFVVNTSKGKEYYYINNFHKYDAYIYIDTNEINNYKIDGICKEIHISSNGYEYKEYKNLYFDINTSLTAAPYVYAYYEDNVGIVLESYGGVQMSYGDALPYHNEYLENINHVRVYSENEEYLFNNIYYDSSTNRAIIKQKYINSKMPSGRCLKLYIESRGYFPKTLISSFDVVSKYTKYEVPKDLNVRYDDNIGLIISSNDNNYLQSIYEINIDEQDFFVQYICNDNIEYQNGKCIINKNLFINNVFGEEITVYLYSIGNSYDTGKIKVKTNSLDMPSDVSVENNNKIVTIKSSDIDYLKNITSLYVKEYFSRGYSYGVINKPMYDEKNGTVSFFKESFSSDAYKLSYIINSNGYKYKEIFETITDYKDIPADLNIYVDSKIGLIVETSDKDYLQSVSYVGFYANGEEHTCYLSLDNYNDPKYSYVSYSQLNDYLVSGNYGIIIYSNGPYDKYKCPQKMYISIAEITNNKNPKYVYFNYNAKTGIEIYSDEDYLKSIRSIDIGDYYVYENNIKYDSKNNVLYISNDVIKELKIVSGTYKNIYIYAENYNPYSTDNAGLKIVSPIKEYPNDLNISFDKNVGIVIKSSDITYLKNITSLNICDNNSYYFDKNDIKYNSTNKYAYISIESLNNKKVISSNYFTFSISANNYEDCYLSRIFVVSISTRVSKQPDDIKCEYDSKIGLKFTSSNKEYLKNMSSYYGYITSNDHEIWFENLNIKYDEKGGYAYISIKEILKANNFEYGTYNSIYIHFEADMYVDSYISQTLNIDLSKSVCDEYVKNNFDYSITYKLTNGCYNNNPSGYDVGDVYTFNSLYRDGYKFAGWYLDSSYKKSIKSITAKTTGDLVLYAKWTPIKYSIKYNLNKGKNDKLNKTSYTVESNIDLKDPIKPGYDFINWTDQYGNVITSTEGHYENLVLTANFEVNPHIYEININYNGGTITKGNYLPTRFGYTILDKISLPTLSKEGYKFKGFYSDISKADGTITYNKKTGDITPKKYTSISKYYTDISLDAIFEPITYKISYTTNSGKITSLKNTYNTTYNVDTTNLVLPEASRTGYIFDGWYTSYTKATKTAPAQFSNKVETIDDLVTYCGYTNSKLYAKWVLIDYDITLDYDGGLVIKGTQYPTSFTYTIEDKITLPTLSKPGYKFLGWYNTNTGKKITKLSKSTGNMNLIATWNNKISFDIYPSNQDGKLHIHTYGPANHDSYDLTINGTTYKKDFNTKSYLSAKIKTIDACDIVSIDNPCDVYLAFGYIDSNGFVRFYYLDDQDLPIIKYTKDTSITFDGQKAKISSNVIYYPKLVSYLDDD